MWGAVPGRVCSYTMVDGAFRRGGRPWPVEVDRLTGLAALHLNVGSASHDRRPRAGKEHGLQIPELQGQRSTVNGIKVLSLLTVGVIDAAFCSGRQR